MDELTIFLWVIGIAGVMCSIFGALLLVNPQVVHKLNQGISRSILSFDKIFFEYNRHAGISLLVIGIALLYMIIRIR